MGSFTQRQRVHEVIAQRKDDHLERLRRYFAQPTIAKEQLGVEEGAQMTQAFFQQVGCTAEIVRTPGLPAVWATYDAGAAKTLVVYGYYDTNVVGSGWSVDPYGAVVAPRGNYPTVLYGRGASNKGGLLAFLNALEAIREVEGTLPVNLMFVVEGEEFMGSEHVPWLIDHLRPSLRQAHAVFSPKPSQSAAGDVLIYLGNKGCIHLELACSGTRWGRGPVGGSIHSSAQGVVDSPVWRLVAALNTLYDANTNEILVEGFRDGLLTPTAEELALLDELAQRFAGREATGLPGISAPDRIHHFTHDLRGRDLYARYCFDTTMNINGIRGGYTGPGTLLWTLPTEAYATVDIRLPAYLDPQVCIGKIRQHLDRHGYPDITIAVLEAAMADHPLTLHDPEFLAAQRVFAQWGVTPVVWPRRGAGGPTGFFSQMLDIKMLNSTGMGYASGHSDANEFLVIEGNGQVGGLVQLEQSLADLMYSYAAYPGDYT